MTDTMQDRNNEESFWDDVDAIRAMLDAEDSGMELPDPMEGFSAASFREEKAAAPQQMPLRQEPRRQAPPQRPDEFRRPAPGQQMAPPRQQKAAPRQQKPVRPKKVKTRDSKGLIITLYVIIAAELAGILTVGAQWYLWMH